MSLPKIAYLTGEYPRASDTFIQREVANLRALGHEVLTCSIRTTGAEHLVGPEQCEEHARTFKVLDAMRNPKTTLKAHWRWIKTPGRYLSALGLAWKTAPKGIKGRLYNLIYFVEAGVLADKLADEGVTHLHNHIAKASCTVAMLAGELSGLRWSFTIHGPDIFFEPHHWRIDEKAARAAFVACISHFCRSQLMCFADAQHWYKLHIVHCGVDPSRYAPKPVRTGLTALFVGRLAGVKGVPILIDAIARLGKTYPDLTLRLVGDGPDRKALESEVAKRGLQDRIIFLGYRSQAEVAEELARADVFVLPSFAEGVPVVLMEAMASQVPVLTTRIAGIPELVEDGVSGRLVPPGDVEAFAEALDALLSDAELRQAYGAAGRAKVVSEYDAAQEAKWLSELIASASEGRTVPSLRLSADAAS
ncbi:glycosyltransferase family 4 protein [Marivita sp. XM-24bin2]|jgi:glycosyltransferase involved in cell wall biosynthesis|uniref:glycosyltransferase family 4 protein n=1 Tax=unclassified Marivita TaxID=2632480 RepID=UPI000D78ED8D|nr:glycosyltransferase family 4 protein [Marivita sp. XM-24bin2]MCR9108306.1 glycosyltransferase family 4 protein [Paracoccaceae bacterium]PWL36343.1 MAG: colanic acid biosynthesis glycosyltransferase WcaL [Marivita sp. XM-24bin2]